MRPLVRSAAFSPLLMLATAADHASVAVRYRNTRSACHAASLRSIDSV